ncbi:MAG: helix-turn-helix transcriptional regulator [Gemmatimonadaceae bacterium]
MLSTSIGPVLLNAREQLNLSRAELAQRCEVSERLLAELERGQRPNVSLETCLKLLTAVGISVRLNAPAGTVAEIAAPSAAFLERAVRAARRRQTWTGEHASLHGPGSDPALARTLAARVRSVARISQQAYAIGSAERVADQTPAVPRRLRGEKSVTSASVLVGRSAGPRRA